MQPLHGPQPPRTGCEELRQRSWPWHGQRHMVQHSAGQCCRHRKPRYRLAGHSGVRHAPPHQARSLFVWQPPTDQPRTHFSKRWCSSCLSPLGLRMVILFSLCLGVGSSWIWRVRPSDPRNSVQTAAVSVGIPCVSWLYSWVSVQVTSSRTRIFGVRGGAGASFQKVFCDCVVTMTLTRVQGEEEGGERREVREPRG